MDRIMSAVLIPVVVIPCAAVVAIAIGILLHQVPRPVAPYVALALVIIVTVAGFLASYVFTPPERAPARPTPRRR